MARACIDDLKKIKFKIKKCGLLGGGGTKKTDLLDGGGPQKVYFWGAGRRFGEFGPPTWIRA